MQVQNQVPQIVYGKTVFKNSVNRKLLQSEEITPVLNDMQWYINYGEYKKCNWSEVFPHMVQCRASMIIFDYNFRSQILKQIKDVAYINLKQLSLYQNKIQNIEPLLLMNCKNLFKLNLGSNCITQIKCLHRVFIQSLCAIYLYNNCLNNISSLTKSKMNSQQFSGLLLQNKSQCLKTISQDLSVIVKLESKQLRKLSFKAWSRIRQPKIRQLLQQRFQPKKSNPIDDIPKLINTKLIIFLQFCKQQTQIPCVYYGYEYNSYLFAVVRILQVIVLNLIIFIQINCAICSNIIRQNKSFLEKQFSKIFLKKLKKLFQNRIEYNLR